MWVMELGVPVVSLARAQLTRLAMFAAWESEGAIDRFVNGSGLGGALGDGWHVRLEFMRRWGLVSEFDGLPSSVGEQGPDAPVVAVTLARVKFPQVPRFVKWGKPVEELVRDHPGTTLAVAAARPPRTVSTFSVWRSLAEMQDMVRGHSDVPGADRHAVADVERRRKDFHYEFTTLRFRSTGEYGAWDGRTGIVPT